MLIPYTVRLEEAANNQPLNLPAGVSTVPHSIKFTMQGLNAARETLERLHQITNGFTHRSDGPLKSAFSANLEAFEVDLREHLYLEGDLLFPRAIALETGLHKRS